MNGEPSFLVDEQALLGEGRRRRCYRMSETGLCAKFYRAPSRLPAGTSLGIRIRIVLGLLCRAANVNYHEWQYHQHLLRHLPKELASVFPEHTEPVHCREKGWGIIETLILNADGTQPRTVSEELKASNDAAECLRIYRETDLLLQRFVESGIRFFDPPNILVQRTGNGAFRLRIADFEPDCRALIPGLAHVGFYVRSKVRRRAARYLAVLRKILAKKQITLPVAQTSPSQHASFFKRIVIATGLF